MTHHINDRMKPYPPDQVSKSHIHALGIDYVQDLLSHAGFVIHNVNKDLSNPTQLLAKISVRTLLIAVRTACYPNVGELDEIFIEKLIKESKELNAIPHFAGLSLTSKNGSDI
ncbi:MAG: hypothetical protein KJO60_03470 [Desulfofustis sp.]|nr:hypothetical protein [Desulfofustis sp.]